MNKALTLLATATLSGALLNACVEQSSVRKSRL